MKPYLVRRIIDIITYRKTLKSCLFVTLAFFLGQLGSLGKSEEIVEYCNYLQSNYSSELVYHISQLFKIFFADGNIIAMIISGVIIALLFYLIYFKESHFEDLEIFDSYKEAREVLGPNKRFRLSHKNVHGISSPNDNATSYT